GQLSRPPALAGRDAQRAPAPVEVLEVQRDHLAGSQAEVDLAAGHGVVPQAGRGRPIEALQEPAELVLGHHLGEVIQLPTRDMGDGRDQGRSAMAVELEEAEEAPQGTGRDLGRAGTTSGGVFRGEGHQILRAEGLPTHGPVAEPVPEEMPGVTESIGTRRLGQATTVSQVPAIELQDGIDRGRWGCGAGSLKWTTG